MFDFILSKLRYRLTASLLGLSVIAILIIFAYVNFLTERMVQKESLKQLELIAQETSTHLESHIIENHRIIETLANNNSVIFNELIKSNQRYSQFSESDRNKNIEKLNTQWKKERTSQSPFIKDRLHNPLAQILKNQSELFPELYGEIFVTNRYGVMLASTGVLSTIAHAHKYWWKGSYNNGMGKIFIDDRGYDESVNDYVLGIVVPIFNKNEIVGIMKANVKIMGPLHDFVAEFNKTSTTRLLVARSNGEVIIEAGKPPLSSILNENIIKKFNRKVGSTTTQVGDSNTLIGFSALTITLSDTNSRYRFGGSKKSIDQHGGFTGIGWYTITKNNLDNALQSSHALINRMFIGGIVFLVFLAAISYWIGTRLSRPIELISMASQEIGQGNFDTKINTKRVDEIGGLARSIEDMVKNLSSITASRDELEIEIKKRISIEEKLKVLAITDGLTGIFNRGHIEQQLVQSIKRAHRYSEPLTIALFDLDEFKNINDTHGHNMGDYILCEISKIVLSEIREVDLFGRWGGEEFIILLPQTSIEPGKRTVDRLRVLIDNYPFKQPIQATISIGITEIKDTDTLESITRRVDSALYQAKEAGRNCMRSIV